MSRDAGKGDSPRPIDLRTYEDNWNKINWGGNNKSNVRTNTKGVMNNNRANTRRSQ
jgi:hypothetical protein